MYQKIQALSNFLNSFAATKNRSKGFQIAISLLVLTIFIFVISRVIYLSMHGMLAHVSG